MKLPSRLVALCLAISPVLHAQSDDAGAVVELSPFEISTGEDRGYAKAIGGSLSVITRERQFEPPGPTVPVTMIKRADAVVVQFALSNSADKQDVRNKHLSTSIDEIAAAIKSVPGLRLEHRQVQLTSGDRRGSLIGKSGVVTSFANIAIFGELSAEMRLYERVKQIKDAVNGTKLAGETKILDGPAGLFIRRPNEYRNELLAKIFADLEVVKKGLGPDFEVLVNGLAQNTKLRACSETEVELWIDYSFVIRSLREMDAKKPATTAR